MTVKRVIFIRPGETDWNRDLRFQGWVAVPLNEHGKRQVQRLANFIRNIGSSALYTSDLKRALETADILADKLGFTPFPDARLRERDIGSWQGLTQKEIEAWYPAEYQQFRAEPDTYRVPQGESRKEVRERMLKLFDDILMQDKGETIAVISHSTAINALLSNIIPNIVFGSVDVSNTSVTTIKRDDQGVWQLVAADDVTHLEGMPSQKVQELEEST
ncbi:MAG: histidine phosphatase family protein [Anaerolineae bacterium]